MKTPILRAAVMASLAIASPASADHWGFKPLLVAGQKPPGASGAITGFDSAAIDDAGHVAVRAKTAAGAMLLYDGAFVVETGPAFAALGSPALSGQTLAWLAVPAGGHAAQFDLLREDGFSNAIAEGGTIMSLGAVSLCGDTPIFAADEGSGFGVFAAAATGAPTVLAPAQASTTIGPLHCSSTMHAGYVRTSSMGSSIALAANGNETTLVEAGAYINVLGGALDASDRVAFYGEYPDGAGIYLASATGTLPIAQTGSLWTSLSAAPPSIDGAGNVYFVGAPRGQPAVVAMGSGEGALKIVRAGDPLFDGHTVKSVIAVHSSNTAAQLVIEVTRDDGADALYEAHVRDDNPVLDAGPDATAQLGQSFCLDGTATDDRTPTAQIPYVWTLRDPNGAVRDAALSATAGTLAPCFTPDTFGVWTAALTTYDPHGFPTATSSTSIYLAPPPGLQTFAPTSDAAVPDVSSGCPTFPDGEISTLFGSSQAGETRICQSWRVFFDGLPLAAPVVLKQAALTADLVSTDCSGYTDIYDWPVIGFTSFTSFLGATAGVTAGGSGVLTWDAAQVVRDWFSGVNSYCGSVCLPNNGDRSTGSLGVLDSRGPDLTLCHATFAPVGSSTPPSLTMSFNICGDGQVDPGEACDDGNSAGGDGCSPACNIEPGWTCTGTAPSVCTRNACTPDTTPPIVALTGGPSTTVECNGTFTDPGATAIDSCAGALTPTATAAPSTATPGEFGVTYTATDSAGNTASATRLVVVEDSVAPVIGTLAQQTVAGNCDGAPVTFAQPTATDSCQSATVTCDPLAGDLAGMHSVRCAATDPSGNTSTTTISVTITPASCATDAGTDAGSDDAGSDDAGPSDAGSSDAGSHDAGSSDAGSSDAGSSDAGSSDAGSHDAGSGSTPATKSGCGCSQADPSSALWLLLALPLRRRRRSVKS